MTTALNQKSCGALHAVLTIVLFLSFAHTAFATSLTPTTDIAPNTVFHTDAQFGVQFWVGWVADNPNYSAGGLDNLPEGQTCAEVFPGNGCVESNFPIHVLLFNGDQATLVIPDDYASALLDPNYAGVEVVLTGPTHGGLSVGTNPRLASINVMSTVINDSGGIAKLTDFPLFVNDQAVVSGETNTFPAPAPQYVVSETSGPGYTHTFSGDCDDNGGLNLNPGENKFCIITNYDDADLTPPTFTVKADPPLTELGEVLLTVEASEELKEPPLLTVTQHGGKSVTVTIEGEGTTFHGIYEVQPGYNGTAHVKVLGYDRAGNSGTKITVGGNFNVNVHPPPPPTIISPQNNEAVTTPEITIRGISQKNTTVVLTANGAQSYEAKPGPDGGFTITHVKLDQILPHGENTLSIVARDKSDTEGEATIVRVSVNSHPTISIQNPIEESALSGTITLRAEVADANNDPISVRYEAFPYLLSSPQAIPVLRNKIIGTAEWLTLGETLSGKLAFHTTELADGKYIFRAIASDGATSTISDPRMVTVKNELPLIRFDDGRQTVVSKKFATVRVRGTIFAPDLVGNRPTIVSLEYSRDGGQSWFTLAASDGAYNSFEEHFVASFPRPSEGVHNILWRATDSRGFTVLARHPVIIDSIPPRSPAILFPENNSFVGTAVDEDNRKKWLQMTLSGKAEPRSTLEITLNGSDSKTTDLRTYNTEVALDGTWRQAVDIDAEGKYTISAISVDDAGNSSGTTTTTFTYNNPPKIVFISPQEGRGAHGIFDVQWLLKDPDGDIVKDAVLAYRRGGDAFTVLVKNPKENLFHWDTTKLPAGDNYELKIEASDGLATSVETIPVVIDNDPPAIVSLTIPEKLFGRHGVLMATGVALDRLSGIEFIEYAVVSQEKPNLEVLWLKGTITGSSLNNKTDFHIKEPLNVSDGTYRLLIRAVDTSGNTSPIAETDIVVDSTPPRVGSLTLSYRGAPIFPLEGHFTVPSEAPLVLAVSMEGDTKDAAVKVDGSTTTLKKDNASGLWKTALLLSKIGTTTVAISATDNAGNRGVENTAADVVVIPTGKVTYQENGRALPVANKTIRVLLHNPSSNSSSEWKSGASSYGTPTDLPDGAYYLALPRGEYQLVISGPSFAQLTTEPFVLSEAQFITTDVTLVQMKKESIWSIIKAWLKKKWSR